MCAPDLFETSLDDADLDRLGAASGADRDRLGAASGGDRDGTFRSRDEDDGWKSEIDELRVCRTSDAATDTRANITSIASSPSARPASTRLGSSSASSFSPSSGREKHAGHQRPFLRTRALLEHIL